MNKKNNSLTVELLAKNLKDLGVKNGDTLLVRADLSKIGLINSGKKDDYLNFILDVIGTEGTLVGLSFTKSFYGKPDQSYIYKQTTQPTTGAFAKLMIKHPNALRSSHPTNSFVAIGSRAQEILDGHNEYAGAYDPVKKIIELNGKMLLIGISKNSPGFTTTHLAELELGINKKVILPQKNTVQYIDRDNQISVFKRTDIGGCSSTYYKFYPFYIQNEFLKTGRIGNAYSLAINAVDAFNTEKQVLSKNKKFTLCKNPDCFHCRARRWDNLKDIPGYYFRKALRKFILFKPNN